MIPNTWRKWVKWQFGPSGVRRSKLHSDRPFVELLGLVALGLLLGVSGQAIAQPNYNYTTLDMPGGFALTRATGINASGQIVGYYTDATGTQHGFLLDNGSYTTLHVPGSTRTWASGINASGQVPSRAWRSIASPATGSICRAVTVTTSSDESAGRGTGSVAKMCEENGSWHLLLPLLLPSWEHGGI